MLSGTSGGEEIFLPNGYLLRKIINNKGERLSRDPANLERSRSDDSTDLESAQETLLSFGQLAFGHAV